MNFESIIKYPAVFLLACVATWALTPWVSRLAVRVGMVDRPDERRIHKGVIPRMGGLAVFLGFHLGALLIFLAPWTPFVGQIDFNQWKRIAFSSLLILLLGLWDDRRNVKASVKLAGQVLVSILTVAMGVRMSAVIGGSIPVWLDWIVSAGWILLLINAFNLIDGMDGLASGLAMVSALGLAASLLLRSAPGDALLFLALAGACLGFLRYNFHPASIFLGDCGSMFLGFMLATLSLATQSKGPALAVVGVPLFAMGIPLLDTLLAIWRRSVRLADGSGEVPSLLASLAKADQEHLHHRLIRSGLGQRNSALLLYGGAIALSTVAVLLVVSKSAAQGTLLIAFVGVFYVIFRHVAVSELHQSGVAVLQGLERPTTGNSSVIIYLAIDTLLLLGSLYAASWMAIRYNPGSLEHKAMFLRMIPAFWGLPMIALMLAGAYSRVWSLARVSEFILIGLALLGGNFVGLGQFYMVDSRFIQIGLLTVLLHTGLCIPLVTFNRALVRVLQDFIALTHRLGRGRQGRIRRVLLSGPSAQAAIALRIFAVTPPPGYERLVVVGILDDDPVFQRRTVHGVRVLGTLDDLAEVCEAYPFEEILVVGDDGTDPVPRLLAALPSRAVSVRRFSVGVTPLFDPR